MPKRRPGSKGQATVELAMTLPILMWLIVGMVDVARMANAYLTIQHASREGVRLGITGASDATVKQRTTASAVALDGARLTVAVTPAGSKSSGTDITVTVSYRYKIIALLGVSGSEVPLAASLTARVE